ncbi:PAS domain S-box-containing protein [Daejeonella rubra]|uniref:histidine kinase n=1 Tax=Daejeonella rubra TaxID=990371 RepID=A0A1G9QRX0_9SPHI|nr:PAS domain-containing sensor histidine kinase [Daejeonella rubra]SDM13025.1 PAS domain S-box-containing protein [Daejeonella rubra]
MKRENREITIEGNQPKVILENIWNNVETIVFITNKECVIQMFNPYAEKNLGYSPDEVIGQMIADDFFDKEELLRKAESQIQDFDSKYKREHCLYALITEFGDGHEMELNMVRKDGSKFSVLLNIFKTAKDNDSFEITAYVFVAKEISELKKIEEHLVKLLEKEKKLNELRTQYLNLASHEFRTPLSVILSSAFIISKFEKSEDQANREEQVRHIVSAVNLLRDIINDFLSLSKIEEGKLRLHKTNFNSKAHIKETIDELSGLLKKGQSIMYRHVGETNLFVDAGIFKHLLINLLSNSIKFSPEDTKISVYSKNIDHKFVLRIKDHGCGISKEDQKQLFSPFFRGSNARQIQGTGLGLHIVRYYLDKMNGTIRVKSKVDLGTTVQIEFSDAIENIIEQTA